MGFLVKSWDMSGVIFFFLGGGGGGGAFGRVIHLPK